MYKLIIGNVRVSINNNTIERAQATAVARQAIAEAHSKGKFLSHIEIDCGENGLAVTTTEKTNCRALRKTLKQSLLDGMQSAIQEKLFPTSTFCNTDTWYDRDNGQEWRGSEVNNTRDDLVAKFEAWMKTL